MYLDKDAILESLTKDDVIKLMSDLGSKDYKEGKQGELIFRSICHGSDSWKLYYYHEPYKEYPGRLCHCYSRCSESFSLWELVIRVKKQQGISMSFYQAVRYVANVTNNILYASEERQSIHRIDDLKWMNKILKAKNGEHVVNTPDAIDEHVLEMFAPYHHELWLNEGITHSAMTEMEIGYFGRDNGIIIPHRGYDGRLVGIRERLIDERDVSTIGKYVPININGKFLAHSLGNTFYGIWQNQSKIKSIHKAIIYESEKSVLKNKGYFGQDDFSLALCGSNITSAQIELLINYLKVEEVIIALDKEFKDHNSMLADLYRNKIYKKIAPLLAYCKVSVLWDDQDLLEYKDSPCDKGKDALLQMLDNKKVITMKDLEVLNEEK